MSAQFKTVIRLLKKQIARFFTVVAILVVSVGFISGIGEVEGKINTAAKEYYQSQNTSDLYIKSKRQTGFTPQELAYLEDTFGAEHIQKSVCFEMQDGEEIYRIYQADFLNSDINTFEILEGRMPQAENEILAERETVGYKPHAVGDKITLSTSGIPNSEVEYTVCGIVRNPLMLCELEETSYQYGDAYVSHALYISSEPIFFCNDVYVTIEDRSLFGAFSNGYEEEILRLQAQIEGEFGEENVTALSLYENAGLYGMVSYGEKVGLIGIVFVVFFLLVTLLVVYSTMSRLLEEERGQIACMKTLGYSAHAIVLKYATFVFVACVIGGLLAYFVGLGLTWIIYTAFEMQYAMPAFPAVSNFAYYFLSFGILTISATALTYFTGVKMSAKKPVVLLTPKAPKMGKKVFLEKIPFLWNKFSFKYKSTLRNVLLFKSRFFMTVIAVTGASVLVFAGMGLMNCTMAMGGEDTLFSISAMIIAFSAALCALVVYNLTNINVSERNREIATLMVLGYQDGEVTGYIFREIYIMSFIGAIIGVPTGLWFVDFVFDLINFGSVADIHWTTYFLTPIVTMFFSFLSTLLLRKKITKTDMNASLKSLE